uniref:COP9 signalosome complex subunit 8 n=1 Tax=Xenopsylla cheopis TaxID=163159 RepID=A0A6M2DJN8_XENCH
MEESLNVLTADLEAQELKIATSNGTPTADLYSKLLALYLYRDELCSAKFLWQRIPEQVKSENPELASIWAVGKCIWLRDYKGIYQALKKTWSEHVSDIMKKVEEMIRTRAINLITQAYSCVSLETVAEMTGLSDEQVIATCMEKGWDVDNTTRMVTPKKPKVELTSGTTSEDQLFKLTEFVSFLEN